MHRPLEKGSCVGGGAVAASLSPPGVTLWMEEDSSEVGNGFVPFSTSEATTGGSLFVMLDMVWTQLPPNSKYKGGSKTALGTVAAIQAHGKRTTTKEPDFSLLKICRNNSKEKRRKRRIPPLARTGANVFPRPHNLDRSGESADSRPGCGRKERMANGECNRNPRLSPADQDRCDPEAGTSFAGRYRRI
jgi:hypothetical protein